MRLYLYDDQRISTGEHVDIEDLYAPVPANATHVQPPETVGDEVAHWNGKAWTVLPERPPAPPPIYPEFSANQMLDLFTPEEQILVVSATMSVPDVKLWYDRMIGADYVTYADPRTEAGLQALVDASLLDPGRKANIVAAMQPEMGKPSWE